MRDIMLPRERLWTAARSRTRCAREAWSLLIFSATTSSPTVCGTAFSAASRGLERETGERAPRQARRAPLPAGPPPGRRTEAPAAPSARRSTGSLCDRQSAREAPKPAHRVVALLDGPVILFNPVVHVAIAAVSAAQFCPAFDELREYVRVAPVPGRPIPLAPQRRRFVIRWRSLIEEMQVASDTSSARRITTPRRLGCPEIL